MMEQREATGTCIMGSSTESPCTYPATEPIGPGVGDTPKLCAYHAATGPLIMEADDMGVCLHLVRGYLKGARKHAAAVELVEALERLEADYARRQALADKVLDDLEAAEYKLMRS